MSTIIWPAIAHDQLLVEQADTIARELEWLLSTLQDTLRALKEALEECAELLAPKEPGSTLVLSSVRSEHLKGFITRVGTRIVKGDVHLRLHSLPPAKGHSSYKLSISTLPTAPTLVLDQLTTTRTLINACLDVVDATLWTGDRQNASFISSQLRLLHENIREAKTALKGWPEHFKPWNEQPAEPNAFLPPLPLNVSFHLSISEAAVLLNVRVLELANPHTGTSTPLSAPGGGGAASFSGLSLRDRLATAFGVKPVPDGETAEIFTYQGQEVRVREKVRVESQDPSLMAALAKLGALERNVALARRALDVLMGTDGDTDDA